MQLNIDMLLQFVKIYVKGIFQYFTLYRISISNGVKGRYKNFPLDM